MTDNIDMNDYELVSLAQEGSEEAINLIYQRYKPIIIKKSKHAIFSATHHGIEISDIMQEGFIGLEEAIRNFSQDQEATFYTFAVLCIDREIVNYLRKTTRGKNRALNEAIILDDTLEKEIKDDMDIEKNLFSRDDETHIIDETRKILTPFELRVFDMKIAGYSFEEISEELGKDLKSLYNTFHRIKIKIRKNMSDDD